MSTANPTQPVFDEDRRQYIRHPVDIPIQVFPQRVQPLDAVPLRDVGEGGLAFRTNVCFQPGSHLIVRIDKVEPVFEAVGVVCWQAEKDGAYETGIRFLDEETRFRARMVEQVCQIERFWRQCLEQGRELAFDEAAREWIDRFGGDFGGDSAAA